jgi:hypothetical protein
MTTRILSCLFFVFSLTSGVFPQEYASDKGAFFFSVSGGFTSQGGDLYENDGNRLNTLMLSPSIHLFIVRHLFIGQVLTFTRQSMGEEHVTTFGIGPALGFAFSGAHSRHIPYVTIGINYCSTEDENVGAIGTDVKVGGGVIFTLKDHFGVGVESGYHIRHRTDEEGNHFQSGNIFSIGISMVGLCY